MRNDIHCPKQFDPAKYTKLGYFYQGPSHSDMIDSYLEINQEYNTTMNEIMAMLDSSSYAGNFKSRGTCDHCGASFSYGIAYQHENGDVIAVGHICATNAFGKSSRQEYEIKKLKDQVKRARHQAKITKQAIQFLEQNEGLESALETDHYIVKNIKDNLVTYGSLTDKQIGLVFKLEKEAKEKKDEPMIESSPVPVTDERIEIIGKVLGFKQVEDRYSYNKNATMTKMIVQDDRGFKVYGSFTAIYENNEFVGPDRGDKISFIARIEQSKDDETFGFFKRPTKVKMIEKLES